MSFVFAPCKFLQATTPSVSTLTSVFFRICRSKGVTPLERRRDLVRGDALKELLTTCPLAVRPLRVVF